MTPTSRSVILLDIIPVLVAYRAEISVLVDGKYHISSQKVFLACRADSGRPHFHASRHTFQVLYGQCPLIFLSLLSFILLMMSVLLIIISRTGGSVHPCKKASRCAWPESFPHNPETVIPMTHYITSAPTCSAFRAFLRQPFFLISWRAPKRQPEKVPEKVRRD